MTIAPTAAANAYSAAAKFANPADVAPKTDAGQVNFGNMVSEALNTFTEAGAKTDQTMLNAATGKADIVDVVTAVAETEIAMQTLVTVRDRVISSYEQIMRMPI